jgi:hypothetical protein
VVQVEVVGDGVGRVKRVRQKWTAFCQAGNGKRGRSLLPSPHVRHHPSCSIPFRDVVAHYTLVTLVPCAPAVVTTLPPSPSSASPLLLIPILPVREHHAPRLAFTSHRYDHGLRIIVPQILTFFFFFCSATNAGLLFFVSHTRLCTWRGRTHSHLRASSIPASAAPRRASKERKLRLASRDSSRARFT